MRLRVAKITRNGITHEYSQLVESYRRQSDGMPATHVIASLGRLNPAERENIKAALDASRQGKRVVAVSEASGSKTQLKICKPTNNLRYLDVAVLLELWHRWKLGELLGELLPVGESQVSAADMVAALSVQRCVAPRSKLYAQRWLPRSALPELTAISPRQFNNTRIHRVLEQLDKATGPLMQRLPQLYASHQGAFVSLFLDVTDSWFVGHGPPMAQTAKTKEGLFARKVGIVLLCNERGYPLRWQVIPGRQHDSGAMAAMLQDIDALPWLGDAPVVMDRAMGKTAHIRTMLSTSVRFLTALTRPEFDSYTNGIPHQSFTQFDVGEQDPKVDPQRRSTLGSLAVTAGMQQFDEDMFVLDLGIGKVADVEPCVASTPQVDKAMDGLLLGTQIDELMREGKANSCSSAGRHLGIANSHAHRLLQLTHLTHEIQDEIRQGKAKDLAISELLRLVALEPNLQGQAFERLLRQATSRFERRRARPAPPTNPPVADNKPKEVRLVAYFNPDMFLEQRRGAAESLKQIEQFVLDLNTRAAEGRARRDRHRLAGVVTEKLRKHEMLDVFAIDIAESTIDDRKCLQVRLSLDNQAWMKRRRYDGFSVLVAHRELKQSPSDLCKLYREKDTVEKDFQWIKSLIRLRPIWHHTNPKLRAHVTLCMLALLLERTLAFHLSESKLCHFSARESLELLEDCRLNRYPSARGASAIYLTTETTDAQRRILQTLQMTHLTNDEKLANKITPR